jgi:glycosyltransferase involved in cell wall biosynthesis
MPAAGSPRVSLGMPVYNAERYLEQALDSLLAQTFENFEIVICDNASTDATEEICRRYAEKDDRIRYFRNRTNYGLVDNFNLVFRLSRGEYFKWSSSDDVCAPDYLKRAVEILDDDPSVVLVFSLMGRIDEEGRRQAATVPGQLVSDRDSPGSVYSPDPVARFRKLIRNIWWVDAAFYGLIRADALAQTTLHPKHPNGDQIVITQLCLKGRFFEIPQELFLSRYHSESASGAQKTLRNRVELVENRPLGRGLSAWWKMAGKYPQRLRMYAAFVREADLSRRQRVACYYEIGRSLAWWVRFRAYKFLARWRDVEWLRPEYPPRSR